jgi:chorismate dehydratase
VLCRFHFGITPDFAPAAPDLSAMTRSADAALLIGDPALFADAAALGLTKIDVGTAWREMTGLPFVYAFWAGRRDALAAADVSLLAEARDHGRHESDEIARECFPADPVRQAIAARYLRENVSHHMGEREQQALERFFELAVEAGVAHSSRTLEFYEGQVIPVQP